MHTYPLPSIHLSIHPSIHPSKQTNKHAHICRLRAKEAVSGASKGLVEHLGAAGLLRVGFVDVYVCFAYVYEYVYVDVYEHLGAAGLLRVGFNLAFSLFLIDVPVYTQTHSHTHTHTHTHTGGLQPGLFAFLDRAGCHAAPCLQGDEVHCACSDLYGVCMIMDMMCTYLYM